MRAFVVLKNECHHVYAPEIVQLLNIILDNNEVCIRIDLVMKPACITNIKKGNASPQHHLAISTLRILLDLMRMKPQ